MTSSLVRLFLVSLLLVTVLVNLSLGLILICRNCAIMKVNGVRSNETDETDDLKNCPDDPSTWPPKHGCRGVCATRRITYTEGGDSKDYTRLECWNQEKKAGSCEDDTSFWEDLYSPKGWTGIKATICYCDSGLCNDKEMDDDTHINTKPKTTPPPPPSEPPRKFGSSAGARLAWEGWIIVFLGVGGVAVAILELL